MAVDEVVIRAAIRDELSGPLRDIQRELSRAGSEAEDAGSRAGRASRGFDRMARGIGGAGRMAGGLALAGVGALGIGLGVTAAAATSMGISTASAMQQARISFSTMLGSAQKADKFLRELALFAASTPFEFPDLQAAASSLISAGVSADKVIPIMRTLGDVTSGMGTGSEGVQRATIALQQMQAAGRITGEDLAQLRDAGIPVYNLLAAATGKSTAEVLKLADAGKLGKKELGQLMTALETGKGLERFSGLMEKQSQSLAGVWSTLKDNVNMGLAAAFQPAIPTLTDLVGKLGTFAGTAIPAATDKVMGLIGQARELKTVLDTFGVETAVSSLDSMTGSGGKLSDAFTIAKGVVDDVATIIKGALAPSIVDVASAIDPSWLTPLGLARAALGFLADNVEVTRVALTGLVAVLTLAKAATIAQSIATSVGSAIQAVRSAITLTAIGVNALLGTSIAVNTGAELTRNQALIAGIGLQVRMGAAMVVSAARTAVVTTATLAWSAATRVAAVAMRVLNVVLRANPLGLVITAVGLLVAGFVLLYQRSETVRNAVRSVWDGLKRLVGFTPLGAILDNFGKLKDVVSFVVDKVRALKDRLGSLKLPKLDLPGIPGFAAGGMVPGGLTLVGERGPELLALPGGSFVLPNEVLSAIRDGGVRADAARLFGSSVAPAPVPVMAGGAGDSLSVVVDRPAAGVDVELAVERVLARRDRKRRERS